MIAIRAERKGTGVIGAAGLAYAACVALPVVILRSLPDHGLALTFWLYAVVWTTDIGAFFIGRALGGPKLWPRISPKKTWSGFVGGTLAGVCVAMLVNAAGAVPLSAAMVLALSLVASLGGPGGRSLRIGAQAKLWREGFEPTHPRTWGIHGPSRRVCARISRRRRGAWPRWLEPLSLSLARHSPCSQPSLLASLRAQRGCDLCSTIR